MEFLKKILKTLCISENDESINRKRCLDDESDSQSNKKVKFEPVWKPQNPQNNSFESNNDNNDTIDSIKTMLNPTATSDSEKELKINRNNSGLEGFVVVN